MYYFRTDLAIESQEGMRRNEQSISGVRVVEQEVDADCKISTVFIDTDNAARYLKRKKGVYVTLERTESFQLDGKDIFSMEIGKIIRRILHLPGNMEQPVCKKVLVVGLGNRQITPDSLGPGVVDQLFVTRHMIMEYGTSVFSEDICQMSAIAPGVMGQTGMECREIVEGITNQIKPDFVVTVDALAARNLKRLGKTVQFTNTGITPGSGVGNHRNAINEKTVGAPVISIGVPTVLDAATIVSDALEKSGIREFDGIDQGLKELFVTPKNIDEEMIILCKILAEGINKAFFGCGGI